MMHAVNGQARGGAYETRRVLCIVARVPVVRQTKTRLGAMIGHEAATEIYCAFLADLGARFTEAARRESYDLCWYYTAPAGLGEADFAANVPAGGFFLRQQGADLNARLSFAFETLHSHGYGSIVVIGTDSPHLPARWIADAFVALETHDVALGPAADGGYYLIGQRVTEATRDLFTGIPMSTAEVYRQTYQRAASLGASIAELPHTFDVDEVEDLTRLYAALRAAPSPASDAAPATRASLDALWGQLPLGEPLSEV